MVPPDDGSEKNKTDAKVFKVRLHSGRVLGPLDLGQVRAFISKKIITGNEVGRSYPDGEWIPLDQIPEIALLITESISGGPKAEPFGSSSPQEEPQDREVSREALQRKGPGLELSVPEMETDEATQKKLELTPAEDFAESTLIHTPEMQHEQENQEKARVASERTVILRRNPREVKKLEDEPTQAGPSPKKVKEKKPPSRLMTGLRAILISLILGTGGYYLLFEDAPADHSKWIFEPVKPQLPEVLKAKPDPEKSAQIYAEAMKDYVADTVMGYKKAARRLRTAAAVDPGNVKALAMLASSYINLIDSSNHDENYFMVLSKLIDLSRAKSVELPETVIADVEFFIVTNKPDSAQNRVVQYTRSRPNFGIEMFYYLALAYFEKKEYVQAAKYLGQYPDNKAFSAKVFFLRGQIAEGLKDLDAAQLEYKKAIQFNPLHVKSHLRMAFILNKKGLVKETAPHLKVIMEHKDLIAPKSLGLAYYLHSELSSLRRDYKQALSDAERAVKLDPDQHDYLLEMYTLKAKQGAKIETVQKQAKMYYYLSEGERLIQQGKYQDALIPLLQAREVFDQSPLPLIKIGDMFTYLHNVENAKMNYKLAAERAPNDIQVWSKYIHALIESYEWEEATQAMDKFRKLPVPQSAIDKAAADMYQKQGRPVEAQTFYRKAMSRVVIDPGVYLAYAKSLVSTRNFADAPFFFALALRFDPLNVDGTLGTARCIAETESIDRAIQFLQDQLRQGSSSRAEYLAAIAELHIQRGAWDVAQKFVDQAMAANPEFALSWKIQGQIHLNKENVDKTALEKALSAFQSFSDRNSSDPSGYLEKYKIYVKRSEFEKAKDELTKIYEVYPKYPNLHYYLGVLYGVQGNHRVAAEEFKKELQNNPANVNTLIAYGKELLEIDQVQDALNQFTKAMGLAPKLAEAKHQAGWANFRLRKYQAAVALIRNAIALDQANPTLHKRLGLVLREMGDGVSACESFREYLRMEPDAQDKAEFRECL